MKRSDIFARIHSVIFACSMLLIIDCPAQDSAKAQHEFPIVKSPLQPNKYERILMTKLRDKNSSQAQFRDAANKLIELLVYKVIDCLSTTEVEIDSPVAHCQGEILEGSVEFVSVMRSGDALLHVFSKHFPLTAINKVLVQRNEETAQPIFKYKKFSPTITHANTVIITEPMIATGGSLTMVIELLKKEGVKEENIVIASICAAPEGLIHLNKHFPKVRVVVTVIDDCLNEHFYISPGIGDFGDRYFGT